MAINSVAFNDTFNKFVNFAEQSGGNKAIARFVGEGKDRPISVATDDKVYAFIRTNAAKSANDVIRASFRASVAEMFGGEALIPPDVKKAMLMKDYGCGKPLTARRIDAVHAAIVREAEKLADQLVRLGVVKNAEELDGKSITELKMMITALPASLFGKGPVSGTLPSSFGVSFTADLNEDISKRAGLSFTEAVQLQIADLPRGTVVNLGTTKLPDHATAEELKSSYDAFLGSDETPSKAAMKKALPFFMSQAAAALLTAAQRSRVDTGDELVMPIFVNGGTMSFNAKVNPDGSVSVDFNYKYDSKKSKADYFEVNDFKNSVVKAFDNNGDVKALCEFSGKVVFKYDEKAQQVKATMEGLPTFTIDVPTLD